MKKIVCPSCRGSEEGFTAVWDVRVNTDVDAHGQQIGGTDFANEVHGRRALNCRACGYSWATSRTLALTADIR